MRLTRKFIAALIAGVILVLGVAAAVNYQREVDLFDNEMKSESVMLGRALGRGLAMVWSRDGERAAFEFLNDASDWRAHIRVRWVWLDARAGEPHSPALPLDELQDVIDQRTTGHVSASGHALYTYVPVEVPGPRRGALELREPLDEKEDYVRASLRNAIIGAGALAVLCTGLALTLGMILIGQPVQRLVAKARKVGAGNLSGPLALRQNDELGELARELNLMCDRLAAEQDARAEATEQLRHAERLTTVGKLAAGMAHELGTPLNVVAGRARLVADGEVEGDDAKASAKIVVDQAERMTRLIRQLLDFARPRPPHKEPAALRALANRVVAMLAPMAQKAGVTVTIAPPADGPANRDGRAEFDDGQLQQVLANLIVNAVQATPAGGTVEVERARATLTPPADVGGEARDWIQLIVRDTGVGIDDATRARIFEPFFTTKPVGEGTGLGLSVSWGIVREHGGWIAVESAPGAGSRFIVHLPATREAAPAATEPARPATSVRGAS